MENFIFCAVIVLNNLGFCGCVKILAPIWCDEIWHVFRMLISYNMANIFRISHILFLFNLPQDYWNKSANYEKLGKYWPYCTRNCAMTRWLMPVLFYQASVSYFSKYFKSKFLYNIFFSIWVFFHEHSQITGLQRKGEGICLTPHYYLHPLHCRELTSALS